MYHDDSRQSHLESGPRLPPALARIRGDACSFRAHGTERAQTARRLAQQTDLLRQVTPRVRVEDGGETIRLGELSPGCVACKEGKWDCVFLSMECNLSCTFCLTPCSLAQAPALSALRSDVDARYHDYAHSGVAGIGFSGGEPLLAPGVLLQSLSQLHAERPEVYLWTYTNGLPLTTGLLRALAEAGLNELRINTAATGYFHAHVTRMLHQAVACLPRVTVEIPAIPKHAGLLRRALPSWSRAGVKHLNLHELIYEPGTPSGSMSGEREYCRMPDGHVCEFNPRSSDLVAEVLRDVETKGLAIAVNYCSLRSKAQQLRGRRRMMAPYTMQAHERLCDDGQAESVCFFSNTRCEFVHPATLEDMDRRAGDVSVALVRRTLPLTPGGSGQWTHFEIIQEGAET